jgi:poly-gamma-glutamate synthesis protein (capsule biosynthesis protein)
METTNLFFAGDFCSKPSTSKITVSEELVSLIRSCDLKIVNFEVPLKPDVTLPSQQRERFFQHDDAPEFLRKIGFNLFSIANNHAFDWGEEGFKKTKDALGDQSFGAGSYDEAYRIKVCEVNGLKIGFMSLSFAAYTGVFDDVMNHNGLGCAYINDLRVNHDIMEAKKSVDYLFILPHDGIEYIDVPLPETIARYRDFIDYGADGVIAAHPHCPQGWEEYKGKPIFYSLGNFLFNSKEGYDYRAWNRQHWYEGMCVKMELKDGEISCTVINTRNVDNIAIAIDHAKERDAHNEKLCELLRNKDKYQEYLYAQCKRLSDVQEMPIIDKTMHPQSLKSYTKFAIQNWIKVFKKQEISNDFSLKTLLRNDTRRNVLVRMLRNK